MNVSVPTSFADMAAEAWAQSVALDLRAERLEAWARNRPPGTLDLTIADTKRSAARLRHAAGLLRLLAPHEIRVRIFIAQVAHAVPAPVEAAEPRAAAGGAR
jgi:hypothetical protein